MQLVPVLGYEQIAAGHDADLGDGVHACEQVIHCCFSVIEVDGLGQALRSLRRERGLGTKH
jgi:hypothetical protein